MTGSATFSNTYGSSSRNAYVENENYSECTIKYELIDFSDPESDSISGWIWALISLSAIICLVFFICTCHKKKKKRHEEALRRNHEEAGALMQQGEPPSTAFDKKPDGFYDVGMPLNKGEVDNRASLNGPMEHTNELYGSYVMKD